MLKCGNTWVDAAAWSLVMAIIDAPGDLLARLALRDRLTELGLDCEAEPLSRPGHWQSMWHGGLYRLVWFRCFEQGEVLDKDSVPVLTNVIGLTRWRCPRCSVCRKTQPSAGPHTSWAWLCSVCPWANHEADET